MTNKTRLRATVCCSALLLAACGGGDDDPAVTEQVPPAASETAKGFIDYLQALVKESPGTLSPVDVSMVTPPSDETSEPTPID